MVPHCDSVGGHSTHRTPGGEVNDRLINEGPMGARISAAVTGHGCINGREKGDRAPSPDHNLSPKNGEKEDHEQQAFP